MSQHDEDSDASDLSSAMFEDPQYAPYALPNINPTINDYRNALDHTQKNEQKLMANNKALRIQVANLKAENRMLKWTSSDKGSRKKKRADPLLNYDKLVLFGKKYAIFVAPWALSSFFAVSPLGNSPLPHAVERFASLEAYILGGILELHKFLESKQEMLDQAVNYTPFRIAFINEVNTSRSTSLYNAMNSAHLIFVNLNLPSNLWARKEAQQRKNSPEFQRLLYFASNNVNKHPKTLIPLYYPNGKKDAHLLFMTEHLTKVLRLTLWGKASLTAKTFSYSPRLLGSKWGAEQVNDSMIAFTAIAAKYLVSEDQEFLETGSQSQIKYYEEFYKILCLLNSLEDSEYYKQLHLFWNNRVFKGKTAGKASALTMPNVDDDSDIDDMAETMRAVKLAESNRELASMSTPLSQNSVLQARMDEMDSDLSTSESENVLAVCRSSPALEEAFEAQDLPTHIPPVDPVLHVPGQRGSQRGRQRGGQHGRQRACHGGENNDEPVLKTVPAPSQSTLPNAEASTRKKRAQQKKT